MATTEPPLNTPTPGAVCPQALAQDGTREPDSATSTGSTALAASEFQGRKGSLSTEVVEHATARLNSFGPFHGSANCLAEMRAQSPPRPSSSPSPAAVPSLLGLMASASGGGEDEGAAKAKAEAAATEERQYQMWMAEHPSALQGFDKFISLVNGRRLAVFLDYDGTLSPIVEDPDKAVMSEGMRGVVREVASHFPTAIISGRGREKVYNFVQLSELYYAGSHGMDIMMPLSLSASCATDSNDTAPTWHQHLPVKGANGMANGRESTGEGAGAPEPAGSEEAMYHDPDLETRSSDASGHDVVLFQPAKQFAPVMEKVFAELLERSQAVAGACIENNNFCVTIHFRRVPEEFWDQLADIVSDVMAAYPSLRTTHGRKVLEIRPQLEWNKGKAVSYLLHTLGLTDRNKVMAIYIGDDRTDEDAFSVLKERGNGCGIVVAASAKSTAATFSLRDTDEVKQFLHRLVCWHQHQQQTEQNGSLERPTLNGQP